MTFSAKLRFLYRVYARLREKLTFFETFITTRRKLMVPTLNLYARLGLANHHVYLVLVVEYMPIGHLLARVPV